MLRKALAAGLSLFTLSSTANAATVELRPSRYSEPDRPVDIVTFTATAGELNTVTARFVTGPNQESGTWQLTDATATLTAVAPCTQIDERNASCPPAAGGSFEGAAFDLGDGDDTFATDSDSTSSASNVLDADGGSGDDRFAIGSNWFVNLSGGAGDDDFSAATRPDDLHSVFMYGGPGDDRLDGSVGYDFLNGGGGQDQLFGRDGEDRLDDGDRDVADPARAPGPDVMDGGPGNDTVTYSRRTAGVSVDLASDGPAGRAGENDVVVGVESATGGRGDDRLAGNRRGNTLTGGRGDDRLVGRGDSDRLDPGAGEDFASCGRGPSDSVDDPRRGTLVSRDCEILFFDASASFTPYPELIGQTQIGYDVDCPDPDGELRPAPCEGSARVSTSAAPHRVLAAASIPRGPWADDVLHLVLPLTTTGQRLAGRRRGVRAVVRVNLRDGRGPIDEPALYAWAIRLQLPG